MRLGTPARDSGVIASLTSSATTTEAQFEDAFERHWRGVFRFALASTNDVGAAEDLAQDAYSRLWEQRKNIDWSKPVLPWLLVTTRRLAIDRFRSLRRWMLIGGADSHRSDGIHERWLDTQRAMDQLSRHERLSIVLTAIEGYSTDEAATILGVSAGAVRAAVSRARAKLEATA